MRYGNADGDSNRYAYADSYAYVDAYGPAETKPDTKAKCDTAASPVSGSGKLIVHSAAGVERPRLRAFVRQASSHQRANSPGDRGFQPSSIS